MNDIERAIENLKFIKNNDFNENIKQYKRVAVKSINLAIEALEKQMPKKPIKELYDEYDGDDWYDEGYTYSCPICKDDASEVGRYSKESE